jgi:Zn-dependent M28 family amino/carboxypeptidase
MKVNDKGVDLHFDFKFNAANDPNRFYYRSDHYSYAKHNIPSVFFFDYMQEDYHKVTDDSDKINYKKLLNVTRLTYDIIRAAANRKGRFIAEEIAVE